MNLALTSGHIATQLASYNQKKIVGRIPPVADTNQTS